MFPSNLNTDLPTDRISSKSEADFLINQLYLQFSCMQWWHFPYDHFRSSINLTFLIKSLILFANKKSFFIDASNVLKCASDSKEIKANQKLVLASEALYIIKVTIEEISPYLIEEKRVKAEGGGRHVAVKMKGTDLLFRVSTYLDPRVFVWILKRRDKHVRRKKDEEKNTEERLCRL